MVPLACGTPCVMRSVMFVAALPISIWPQAIRYDRQSSEMLFVSPVIACLVAVYGADLGLGAWAEIDTVINDAATLRVLCLHYPDSFLRAQESAGEIDVHDRAPLFKRYVLEGIGRRIRSRVIKQQIQTPELTRDRLKQFANGFRTGHVGRYRQHSATRGGPHLCRLLELLGAPSCKRDRIAGSLQCKAHGSTDSAARACD